MSKLTIYSKEALLKLKLKRELQSDYMKFVQYAFFMKEKKKFNTNSHHTSISEFLTKIVNGDMKNGIINIAPRYSKTSMAVVYFVPWCYANNPRCNFMHLSYSDSLVEENSDDIREVMKSDWYQDLWPLRFRKEKDSKKKWKIDGGGTFFAAPTGGQVTGMGAGSSDEDDEDIAYAWLESYGDYLDTVRFNEKAPHGEFSGAILIDDPIKPDDAFSEQLRGKINRRLTNTILSRRNSPKRTPIILMMQRVHDDDMTGHCLSGRTGEKWEHLAMPTLQDDGKALWPFMHSVEQLEQMQGADAMTFAGQYQQQPAPPEGAIIKRSQIKYYDTAPHIDTFDRVIHSWDFTFKGLDNSDFVVGQVWGVLGAKKYLIYQVRDRMNFVESLKAIEQIAEMFPQYHAILVEEKANGAAIVSSIESKISRVVPISPAKSKESRLFAVSPEFQAGNVLLPSDEPWVGFFVEELIGFPNWKNDDQVDACTQVLNYLRDENHGSFLDFLEKDDEGGSFGFSGGIKSQQF